MTQHIKIESEQRNYNHNHKNDNRDVCVCLKHEFDLYFMWKRTVFGKEDTKIELGAFLCIGETPLPALPITLREFPLMRHRFYTFEVVLLRKLDDS